MDILFQGEYCYMEDKWKKWGHRLALLIVFALAAGIRPAGKPAVSASAVKTAGTGYGLNNPRTDSDGITTWDCVWFGNYWQEDTNGDGRADQKDEKKPIRWRVLSVKGDDAFLLADQNLDCQKYNDSWTDVTWETCTMRSWLNGYGAGANKDGKEYGGNNFLTNAFSAGERSAIRTTKVVNGNNPYYGTEGGNDTSDQVFLLSLDEVMDPVYGFSSDYKIYDAGRRAENTEYVKGRGAYTSSSKEYAGNGWWWLRSPGDGSDDVASVYFNGFVSRDGNYDYGSHVAVRPALHLNLGASSDAAFISGWSYAGTVISKKGGSSSAAPTPTPSAPKPAVTWEPDAEATSGPGGEATAGQGDDATVKPGDEATVKPGDEATAKPGDDATVKPGDEATAKPGDDATAETTVEPGTGPSFVTDCLPPVLSPDAGRIGKVAAVKLKQKRQSVAVSWKKVSGAAGYQICYGTSKKWKNKKQKLTWKNKFIVKKLKEKKVYYFRVRAYRMNGAKKRYGVWSKTKRITIKK